MSDKSEKEPKDIIALSVTPSLSKLLEPTAELLGQELRDFAKGKIDGWKEGKRRRNVDGHFKKVKEKTGEDASFNTVRQAELFLEWIEGAQDVEADGSPLADLWQELLAKIALGVTEDRELIDKLKVLSPDQARTLLKCAAVEPKGFFAESPRDLHNLRHLAELDLVLQHGGRAKIALSYTIAFIFVCCIVSTSLILGYPSIDELKEVRLISFASGTIMLSFALSFLVILYSQYSSYISRTSSWKTTWIGNQLVARSTSNKADTDPRR